jgi:DNA-binding NarL/FixJ family response regulator
MTGNQQDVTTVIIVDDHYLMRAGLRSILTLEDDLKIVGEATTGEEALALVEEHQPDVVLTDLKMPGMGGPTLIAEMARKYPHVNVIALTAFSDESLIREVIGSGAMGYFLKDTDPDAVLEGIRAVRRGERVFSPTAEQLFTIAKEAPPSDMYGLTDRELEVLEHMTEGRNNPEIAQELSISPLTVKTHVRNIFTKMNVSSRTEAVIVAIQRDMFSTWPPPG